MVANGVFLSAEKVWLIGSTGPILRAEEVVIRTISVVAAS